MTAWIATMDGIARYVDARQASGALSPRAMPNTVMQCLHRDNMPTKKEKKPTPSSQRPPQNIIIIDTLGGSRGLTEAPSMRDLPVGCVVVER